MKKEIVVKNRIIKRIEKKNGYVNSFIVNKSIAIVNSIKM